MKNAVFLMMCIVIGSSQAQADPTSRLTLRIKADLDHITAALNSSIPMRLHHAEPRREICVEAERACTKIPEFRGLKIHSRLECVDITPRISCDISEMVTRAGNLRVTGEGSTLIITESVSGSATARGRGAIGKNIRQTVRGSADVTARVQASLAPNWMPQVEFSFDKKWNKRPEVNLFGMIPVSVGTQAERAIDAAEARLRQTVPGMMENLGLRARADALWHQLQEPLPIPIASLDGPVFAHIQPQAIAFSGMSFTDGEVHATTELQAQTRVTDSVRSPWPTPSALPDLSTLSNEAAGYSLTLPVSIQLAVLNQLSAQMKPYRHQVSVGPVDQIEVDSVRMSASADRLIVDTTLRVFGNDKTTLHYEGPASFSALLKWDSTRQQVTLDDLQLERGLNRFLRGVFKAGQYLGAISRSIDIPVAQYLATVQADVESAMNKPLSSSVILSGSIAELQLSEMTLSDSTVLATGHASGVLDVELNLSQ
jgi:hypothetical protein